MTINRAALAGLGIDSSLSQQTNLLVMAADLELIQSVVLFRHGERTPVRKRLPDHIPSYWDVCRLANQFQQHIVLSARSRGREYLTANLVQELPSEEVGQVPQSTRTCADGQLSDLGRSTTLALGSKLRDLYAGKLIPSDPASQTADQFYFRATPIVRAQESLFSVLAGLFPKRSFVPSYVVRDYDDETMIPDKGNCKALSIMRKAFVEAVDKASATELAKLDSVLEPLTGQKIRILSSPSANGILDTTAAARAHNIPLPSALTDEQTVNTLTSAVVREWFEAFTSPRYTRLSVGPFFGELLYLLRDKVTNPDKPLKLALLSGHDTTLGAVLNGLSTFDQKWPPFTAHIRIELLQKKAPSPAGWFASAGPSKHFVRVVYNDSNLTIPACSPKNNHLAGDPTMCTYEAFSAALQKHAISKRQYVDECKHSVDRIPEIPAWQPLS